jgi:heme oxygenase
MTSAVLQAVRAATHHLHEILDARLDLPERLADMSARGAIVRRFEGFQAGLERALGDRLDHLAELELGRRRRAHRFEADHAALGGPARPRPPSCPVPAAGSVGEALGLLYVGEGSTLGGKVIGRRLEARGAPLTGLGFLDPYGDDTGSMWRGFLAVLETHGGGCADQVVAGGVSGFTQAVAWLCGQEAST